MKIMKLCNKYLYEYKFSLFFLILITIILKVLNLSITYITGNFIDQLLEFKTIKIIYYNTFIILIIGTSNAILSNFCNYYLFKTQAKIVFELNYEVLRHIKKLPMTFFKNTDTVYLNQRINNDSNAVIGFSVSILINSLIMIVSFISIFLLMYNLNIKITIIVLLSIPIYIFLYMIFKKPLYKSNYDYKEEQSKFFSKMNDQLSNISFIKLNSAFEVLDNELKKAFPSFLKSLLKYFKFNYLFLSADSTIENIFNIFLFFYGGIEIINNRMTIGSFIIIKGYYTVLLSLINGFLSLGKSYQETLTSYDRLIEILDTPKEHNGDKLLKKIDTIELQNIKFSFDKKMIFDKFSYKFQKGNIYLINGLNGIGKSTLINIICGLYVNSYEGDIFYNEENIKNLDLYATRKILFGIVEQESLLLNTTLYDNLTYGINNVQRDLVDYWCDKLDLKSLDLEENILLDNRKINMSGGEKQKIALVRVFIKNTNIIIMDEPTSALDINSINVLNETISKVKEEKIIIIISHNNLMKLNSDYIINL
ncbi:ABC transporter ATP-binding protein [uncultured Clostridium sp.]|uniref:ABC transporter ATP-binding protein n=1 Tax=uncultured Clostridium sp. TaxID=59620 RepID=UPI0032169871